MRTNVAPSARLQTTMRVAIGAAIIIALTLSTMRSPWVVYDDAFITYRYANNLRDGLGFVYNAGEQVLGITTPLYGLTLALIGRIAPNTIINGYWLAVAGWLGIITGAAAVLHQHKLLTAAIIAPLAIAVHPNLYDILGMETTTLIALMLWTRWAWRANRFWLTVLFAALTLLIRQDSAVFLFILGIDAWWRTKRFPLREGIATVLLTLPWFLYAWRTYGSPLPNSASAKIGQQGLMQTTSATVFYGDAWQAFSNNTTLLILIALIIMTLIGVLRGGQTRNYAQLMSIAWLPLWVVSYLAIYTGLGVVSFDWYFGPSTAGLIILFAVGTNLFGRHLPQLPDGLHIGIIAIVWGMLIVHWGSVSWRNSIAAHVNQTYAEVGTWLEQHTDTNATAATIEIGLIGYLSERPIIDTMGLVTTELTDHQLGWAETLVYALNTLQPDYAIALTNTAWDAVTARWWFQENYQPVASFDRATIYERTAQPLTQIDDQMITFSDGIIVSGLSVQSPKVTETEALDFTIHIDVAETPREDYILTSYLVNTATFERVGFATSAPFDGLYRTSIWQAGDQLAIPMRIELPQMIADGIPLDSGAYRVGVSFYKPEAATYLGLAGHPDGEPPDVWLGWLATKNPPLVELQEVDLNTVSYSWDGGIILSRLGVGTSVETGKLQVAFEWDSAEKIGRNLKLFIHMLDSTGGIIAQSDSVPLQGRWPTTVWDTPFIDLHEVILPQSAENGTYDLRIGFYDEAGQLPLSVDSAESFILLSDAVTLQR